MRWKCQLALRFFGLKLEDKQYIYEELFVLTYHCRISYTEAWYMPVEVRKWWIHRVNKELEKEKKQSGHESHKDPFGGKHG